MAFNVNLQSYVECPITNEPMNDPYLLIPCGHSFEKTAIENWVRKNATCPLDRSKIKQMVPNHGLKSLIEKIHEIHDSSSRNEEEIERLRTSIVRLQEALDVQTVSSCTDEEEIERLKQKISQLQKSPSQQTLFSTASSEEREENRQRADSVIRVGLCISGALPSSVECSNTEDPDEPGSSADHARSALLFNKAESAADRKSPSLLLQEEKKDRICYPKIVADAPVHVKKLPDALPVKSSLPSDELATYQALVETLRPTWEHASGLLHYHPKQESGYPRSLLYIRESPGNKEGVYLIRDDASSDRITTIEDRTLVDVIDLADPSKRLLLSIMEKGALTRHEQEMLSLRWKLHGVVHPTHSFTSGQNKMALYPLETRSSLLLPRMLWLEEQEMEDLISSMRELHKDEILLRAPYSVSLKDEYGLTRRAFLDASLATTEPQRVKDPCLHDKLGWGNRYYWAPEVLKEHLDHAPKLPVENPSRKVPPPKEKKDPFSKASDIWLLGLRLWKWVSEKHPDSTLGQAHEEMTRQDLHPTEFIKTRKEPEDKFTLDHMIFWMLRPEPTERLTIFEVEKRFCSYIALKMIASFPYVKNEGENDHEQRFWIQWTEAVKSSDPKKLQTAIDQVRSLEKSAAESNQATPSEGWSPLSLALSLILFYT